MRQHQLQGAIYCLIATASWGAIFPVMTGALVRIDPFTFTSLRYLIAGAAFLAVLIFKEGWSAVHFKGERMLAAWLFGTAGFAGFNFLMFATYAAREHGYRSRAMASIGVGFGSAVLRPGRGA